MVKNEITLKNCTLEQFKEAVRGGGYSHETVLIRQYFRDQQFCVVEECISNYNHSVMQYSMQNYFENTLGFSKILETAYEDGSEIAVTFENLEVAPKEFIKIYKTAFVLYEDKNHRRYGVSVAVYSREMIYRIYTPIDKQDILYAWKEFSERNNFYKGKKIDADGKFLELNDVSWDDIILDEKTLNVIKAHVHEIFKFSEYLRANKLPLKRGVIFSGPPGTGKTMLVKALIKEVDSTVIYALPNQLERARDIQRVCEMAKSLSPCMLIIEDIDWIAEERAESQNAASVIQLMNYLDGVQEFSDIVTLATTNNADKIEDAIKNRPGRFDRVITIPKPNKSGRAKMFERFTKDFIIENVDINKFITDTDGMSGAHVKDVCITAALNAIRAMSVKGKIAVVTQSHFNQAIKEIENVDYSTAQKTQINSKRKMGFNVDDF
jgi:cell division protease FtsH